MTKPQPKPTPWDAPFWEGARNGELRLQECQQCGRIQMYPRPMCLRCFGSALSWRPSPGRGRLYSFTAVRAPLSPAFKDETPIYFADVELDEGVRMLVRIIDGEPTDTSIDARVQIVFAPNEPDSAPLPCARLL